MVRAFTRMIKGLIPAKPCPVIEKPGAGKMSAHWIIDDQHQGKCTRFKQGKCGLNGAQCHCNGERDFHPFSVLDQDNPELRKRQYNLRNIYGLNIKRRSNVIN